MGATKIEIISMAIGYLGKGKISSTSAAGQFAEHADLIYRTTINSVLAKDNWRFATAIQQLSKLVDVPVVDDWQYIYTLPATYLSLVRLYPETLDFQIYENKYLYSNVNDLYAEYRFKPDESKFPDYFIEFYSYYLASRLAITAGITEEITTVLGKNEMIAYRSGLAADGCSHPNIAIRSAPYIAVRGAGGGG